MYESVEDLTVTYEDGGQVVVEELDKQVLSKGSWATVLYKYREWNARKEEMGPAKFTLRRYQKRNGSYRQQAKFNISSEDQARKICDALQGWLGDA